MNAQVSTSTYQDDEGTTFFRVGDWRKGAYIASGFKANVFYARHETTGEVAVVKIGSSEHGVKDKEVQVMKSLPIHAPRAPPNRKRQRTAMVVAPFAEQTLGQICQDDTELTTLWSTLNPSMPTCLFATTLSAYTDQKKLLVIFQLLEALDALHQNNITHGDIHERNIAFVNQQLVVLDFGEANIAETGTCDANTGRRLEKGEAWKLAAKDVRRCGWVALWLFGYTESCYNPLFNPDRSQVNGRWLRDFPSKTPQNLIYQLCRQNPNDQPTAGEALRHACFKEMTPLSPKGVPQCLASRGGECELSKPSTGQAHKGHSRYVSINIPVTFTEEARRSRPRLGTL